jgi:hypothetical protein
MLRKKVLWADGGLAEEEMEGVSEEGVWVKLDYHGNKKKKAYFS